MATKKKTVKKKAVKKKSVRKKAVKKKAARKKSTRGKLAPAKTKRGLKASQIVLGLEDEAVAPLVEEINAVGGAAIGAYAEPLSGRPVLIASIPIKAVQPTPFQRDLSPTHTKRLAEKIDEAGSSRLVSRPAGCRESPRAPRGPRSGRSRAGAAVLARAAIALGSTPCLHHHRGRAGVLE